MSTIIKKSEKKLLCTVYTDASWKEISPKRGKKTVLSSWAMYARCKDEKIEMAQSFTNNSSESPTHAEARAIYNAIKKCYNKWPDLDIIFVNTDSLAVCHSMWPDGIGRQNMRVTNNQPETLGIINVMKEWIEKRNLIHRFKHVKAHTGGNDIRSKVNDLVDRKAKEIRLKSERQ